MPIGEGGEVLTRLCGKGNSFWVLGDRYTFKLSSVESGGALAVVELTAFPQNGPHHLTCMAAKMNRSTFWMDPFRCWLGGRRLRLAPELLSTSLRERYTPTARWDDTWTRVGDADSGRIREFLAGDRRARQA